MDENQMEKIIQEWSKIKSKVSANGSLFEDTQDSRAIQLMQVAQLKRIADSLKRIEIRMQYR